jgi:hypothetical protein
MVHDILGEMTEIFFQCHTKKMPKRKRSAQKNETHGDLNTSGGQLRSGSSYQAIPRKDSETILSKLNSLRFVTQLYPDLNGMISDYASTGCTVQSLVRVRDSKYFGTSICLLNDTLYIGSNQGIQKVVNNSFSRVVTGSFFSEICNIPNEDRIVAIGVAQPRHMMTSIRFQQGTVPDVQIIGPIPVDLFECYEMCLDKFGNVYMTSGSQVFHMDIKSGTSSVYAGTQEMGSRDSSDRLTALFTNPSSLCIDHESDRMFICEDSLSLRCIDMATGKTRTVSRKSDENGSWEVSCMKVLSKFELIVGFKDAIGAVNMETGVLRMIAGLENVRGRSNGSGDRARFDFLCSLCLSPDRNTAYVLDESGVRVLEGLF